MTDPFELPDPNFVVPDMVEAIEGWRAWKVNTRIPRYGLGPKLGSVTKVGFTWPQRRAARAQCYGMDRCITESLGDIESRIPGDDCHCGFYTAKTLQRLLKMRYPRFAPGSATLTVIGRVANWGKVIEGSHRVYRSEFAYPVALWTPLGAPDGLAEALSEAYGVPCREIPVTDWRRGLERWTKRLDELDRKQ